MKQVHGIAMNLSSSFRAMMPKIIARTMTRTMGSHWCVSMYLLEKGEKKYSEDFLRAAAYKLYLRIRLPNKQTTTEQRLPSGLQALEGVN